MKKKLGGGLNNFFMSTPTEGHDFLLKEMISNLTNIFFIHGLKPPASLVLLCLD